MKRWLLNLNSFMKLVAFYLRAFGELINNSHSLISFLSKNNKKRLPSNINADQMLHLGYKLHSLRKSDWTIVNTLANCSQGHTYDASIKRFLTIQLDSHFRWDFSRFCEITFVDPMLQRALFELALHAVNERRAVCVDIMWSVLSDIFFLSLFWGDFTCQTERKHP